LYAKNKGGLWCNKDRLLGNKARFLSKKKLFLSEIQPVFAILPPFCHAQPSDYQRVLQNGISCITFKNFM